MSIGDTIKNIANHFTGEAFTGAVEGIQDRIEQATKKVIKASVLYILFLIGLLFTLVGLANFLQAHYYWTEGLGFIVVGLALIILGLLVKALK